MKDFEQKVKAELKSQLDDGQPEPIYDAFISARSKAVKKIIKEGFNAGKSVEATVDNIVETAYYAWAIMC